MNRSLGLLLVLLLSTLLVSCLEKPREKRVLVFSKTAGFRHASIEAGIIAINKMGRENGFKVFHTEDASQFKEEFLSLFSAVIFLNTTGDILDATQQAEFERYIQAGGGFVGIHAAADTEYHWSWYGKLVGAYFMSHPATQEATSIILDGNHPATRKLGKGPIVRTDEWYDYKQINPDIKVLMRVDESTYEGGKNGAEHPISWYHEYDGGRAFYTGWGHTPESYSETVFLQHLWGGIKYAIGKNQPLDYNQAHTYPVPAENRFVQTVLASNLNEPMELDIFDDGKVILVERKGGIKLWDPEKESLRLVTMLPVWDKFEDGLMGVAIDPDYEETNWVYVYYAPPGEASINVISRFDFDGETWDYESEKVILEVKTQRITCCHSGGSLEFDQHGNLFLSTGDDTNPFASNGFAPIDEREGREPWDAQRTSSNTNDLRGKILRIHPEKDGSYTIPEGNLFLEGTPNAHPEIFVMGCRNPFRIAIDQKKDWLYWGDVGPDAGKDGENRGPKGYDEVNQAQVAGYYGWPYFRGDGKVYHDYDFTAEESGPKFNPEKPINDSPNNTGLKELPPFQPSLIWYSYDASQEFPWTATGGKNPMAGPVFHKDAFPAAKQQFPDYFDNKLFIYEWMRHWIYIVKMDEEGNFIKADPFMPSANLKRPMDMVFGKDGALYLLEYGMQWFARNPEARLSKIEYVDGNRAPIARIEADKTVGAAPMTVGFSAAASEDLDGDALSYEWIFKGGEVEDRTAYPTYTFTSPGTYRVKLKVKDPSGLVAESAIDIQVGNEPPSVAWDINGNNSLYWNDGLIDYEVKVKDREDGSLTEGTIPSNLVKVNIDYLEEGYDLTVVAQGHQMADATPTSPIARGAQLVGQSDCKNCHAEKIKINGPSYLDISQRYKDDENAVAMLSQKVIAGGGGNWGETAMSAHPQLTQQQAENMVKYILSLSGPPAKEAAFATKGTFLTDRHDRDKQQGVYVLMATYTDQGSGNISSITKQNSLVLRAAKFEAEQLQIRSEGVNRTRIITRNDGLGGLTNNRFIGLTDIDFTSIEEIHLRAVVKGEGQVEVRLDQPDGEIIGTFPLTANEQEDLQQIQLPLKARQTTHDVYLVFKNKDEQKVNVLLDWLYFSRGEDSLALLSAN